MQAAQSFTTAVCRQYQHYTCVQICLLALMLLLAAALVMVLWCVAELTCALLTHTHDLSTGTHSSWHADYWQTLSSCLTDLYLKVDAGHAEELQPCLLKGLSRLTFLKYELTYDDESGFQCDNFPQLDLPELRQLVVGYNRWV